MGKLKTRVVFLEHKVKVAAISLASKIGFRKYRELLEGKSKNMTNDLGTPRFQRLYGEPEEKAVREWMETGGEKSYLDIGAGSGRFTKVAFETGASKVVAIDINEGCIAALKALSKTLPGLRVKEMDVQSLSGIGDDSVERSMILGNTLGGMYRSSHGSETSFQAEVVREVLRVTKEEICITLQRPASLRLMLQYYRMNGLKVYGYDSKEGIRRIKMEKPGGAIEYRSQHFRKEQIEEILGDAGVSRTQYSIKPINKINWIVVINKKN